MPNTRSTMEGDLRPGPKDHENFPIGNCPSCGLQLTKAGHENRGDMHTAGRYTCMNRQCSDRRWFNRTGEPRFGG
jgi:hypothetical protein